MIHFYKLADTCGSFSNFARFPIKLDGKTWPTTEHYFQAQKFPDEPEYQEAIRKASTPRIAADMGRDRGHKLREDWEAVKDSVMKKAVAAKFFQHNDLQVLLMSTGQEEIAEHTTKDSYWGDGGDGSGKNMLGRIIMEVRKDLNELMCS